MGKLKKSLKLYDVWNWDRELDDLNTRSAEGWQLVKNGYLISIFEESKEITYRYESEYKPGLEDRDTYIKCKQKSGWEYLNSTFNGWHYFRKEYRNGEPESEYRMEKDLAPSKVALGIWDKLATFASVLLIAVLIAFIIAMIALPKMIWIPIIAFYITVLCTIFCGIINLKRIARNKPKKFNTEMTMPTVIIVVCIIAFNVLAMLRPQVSNSLKNNDYEISDASGIDVIDEFTVKYPDYYYLNLRTNNENPILFSITDDGGTVIYSSQKMHSNISGEKIKLSPGTYTIALKYISCESNQRKLDISYSLD